MFSTDPDNRHAFITGLRDLADYLTANPGLPVPPYGTTITVHADTADHGGRGQVDTIAVLLGIAPEDNTADIGYYEAGRSFGPVSYLACAASEQFKARYEAHLSYWGCVLPDEAATDA
jgi:hypothetical protein